MPIEIRTPPRLSPGSVITYRAGATSNALRGLHGSFADALAAAQASGPGLLYFDPRSDGMLRIPAGTWDLTTIGLTGGHGATPSVFLDDGAKLVGLEYVENVLLVSESDDPIIEVPADGLILQLGNYARLSVDGGSAPFIHAGPSAGFVSIDVLYSCMLDSTTAPILDVDLGAFALIVAGTASTIGSNTLDGGGSITVIDGTQGLTGQGAATISHTQDGTDITYS